MKKDEKVLYFAIKISEEINVTPPNTIDIGNWWEQALKEMDIFWLHQLKECGLLLKIHDIGEKMHNKLLEQIEKRQLLNTLV